MPPKAVKTTDSPLPPEVVAYARGAMLQDPEVEEFAARAGLTTHYLSFHKLPFLEGCVLRAEAGDIPPGSVIIVHDGVFHTSRNPYAVMHPMFGLLGLGIDLVIRGQRFKADLPPHLRTPSSIGLVATVFEVMTGTSAAVLFANVAGAGR